MNITAYFKASEISTKAWVIAGLFLPLNKSVAVAAILVIGLFSWTGNAIPKNLKTLRKNYFLWLPPLYFVWHLISLIWSENKVYGSHDLETKLSFLLVPTLIGAAQPGYRARFNFFIALTVGVILNGLWSIFNAFQAYEQDFLPSHFFYIELSQLVHVAYLTMMVTFCILFLTHDLFYPRRTDPQPWALTTAMLMLALFTVMLDSRTAFFTMIIVCIAFFLVTASRKMKLKSYLGGFLLFIALFAGGYLALSTVHNRMAELGNVVKTFNEETAHETEGQEIDYGNAGVRPVLWKNAVAVISRNPFIGVGCGDIKNELEKQYADQGFLTGVRFKLNPHNQYLHTAVTTGFVGLTLLLIMLIVPAWNAFFSKQWFTFACLSVFIMNALTESVLEVQNGILLFAAVYSLVVPGLHAGVKRN
jgi:O-antigen ligase